MIKKWWVNSFNKQTLIIFKNTYEIRSLRGRSKSLSLHLEQRFGSERDQDVAKGQAAE